MKLTSGCVPCAMLLLGGMAAAQAQDGAVYQCTKPDAPMLYTDAAGARGARAQGHSCQPVQALPVTIPQAPRPRGATTATAVPAAAVPASRPAVGVAAPGAERVAPQQQRERDSDARAILQAELQREQARLQLLLTEYNDGQPERLGHERNHQRYLDRVAALKASIERCSADIAALQRELSRVSRP